MEELRILRRDGRELRAEVSRAVSETDGERSVTGVFRDVSARHRAEQKLRGLLESAPDAIVIANRGGEIVLANARAEAIFGYTREELIGSSVELLMPEQKRQNTPRCAEDYADHPRPRHGSRPGDFKARRKDGSVFAAEITLNPIETDEGLLVSSAIRDVTDRRRADEATARLAAIVTSSPNAIIGVGTDATIESWNAGARAALRPHRPGGDRSADHDPQPTGALTRAAVTSTPRLPVRRSRSRAETSDAMAADVETWVTISPIRDGAGRSRASRVWRRTSASESGPSGRARGWRRSSSPPMTRSSAKRSTARSPAGIARPSGSTATAQARPPESTSRCCSRRVTMTTPPGCWPASPPANASRTSRRSAGERTDS